MFLYKFSSVHHLGPDDYSIILEYAHHVRRDLRNGSGYSDGVMFIDECVFHTGKDVNKHYARIWGQKISDILIEVPQNSEKFIVRCWIQKIKIIALVFLNKL